MSFVELGLLGQDACVLEQNWIKRRLLYPTHQHRSARLAPGWVVVLGALPRLQFFREAALCRIFRVDAEFSGPG